MPMEQLFGSRTRVKILNIFLRNPEKTYFVRELSRMTGDFINSIRRELQILQAFGLLVSFHKDGKRYYQANQDFFLFEEITALFSKAEIFLENQLIDELKSLVSVVYLVFSGVFTGIDSPTDILIVGTGFDPKVIAQALARFSGFLGREIRYTLMETEEFTYRQSITDEFIFNVLLNKKIVVVDKIGISTVGVKS